MDDIERSKRITENIIEGLEAGLKQLPNKILIDAIREIKRKAEEGEMAEFHDDGIILCEDCEHFHAYGMDGEGECLVTGDSTYYGAYAGTCDDFTPKEG